MPDSSASNSRVRAFIFDLDGTLVETERLKAKSYATVVGRLTGANSPDRRAIELYERIVGSTDEMVCRQMIDEFGIADSLEEVEGELWKHLHQIRMDEYRVTDGAPNQLLGRVYQHNIDLLRNQKANGRTVSVATSSFSDEAKRVLEVLGVRVLLDDIVGRESVTNPKPDPEIYLLAMERLGLEPEQVVIVEDSPIGTKAAMASGASWICVSTPFSYQAIEASSWLDPMWVVHDPAKLTETVNRRIESIDQS
ncbi:HAD family hydrolase [Candidatus Lucifugimonas marina]|jgi:HAD superfamily hydrolase (TIGR01509 family)|uniref:HAD-IA family hydrolase n=1 Tax=Candidatus Lucifugimonas marina TaxID=3038979 RepID=A0AAJ5ZDS9_9CHLR|nr:HAD-IA family hydrolase [SAR202 cluster bacterium JH702]MDG0869027.1 HAD-IA family hydrolase [SAR202 cluster bacterium JH639]WFG35650.1 HAD-IA family hydrolase [SAR202 cluster bacterium JH545]WFG39597.1 HAD-IA family hydrolase [SAR202 cluster bacterium JH1073]